MYRDFDQSTIHTARSVASTHKNKDHYKNIRFSGPYKAYDPITGQVVEEGQFLNGVQTGLWKLIDQDGDEQHFNYRQQRIGARCGDGSFSSATGRGACSWHGGVSEWLHQNRRFPIGGTGKYESLQSRIEKAKLILKNQLKINVNKPNDQLMVEVMQKLIKSSKNSSESSSTKQLQKKLKQTIDCYEDEIQGLQTAQAILASQNQGLKQQKSKSDEKIKSLKLENDKKLKQQQQRYDLQIEELKNKYQQKIDFQHTQIIRLKQKSQKIEKSPQKSVNISQSSKSRRQDDKTSKKKSSISRSRNQDGNSALQAKIRLIQEQLMELQQTVQVQQQRSYSNSYLQQDSRQESSFSQSQSVKAFSQVQNISCIMKKQPQMSHQNKSFSYAPLLVDDMFEINEIKISSTQQKAQLFNKKTINQSSAQILKSKPQPQRQNQVQSDQGLSLRTDSSDLNDWSDQEQEQQQIAKVSKEIIKTIPSKQVKPQVKYKNLI